MTPLLLRRHLVRWITTGKGITNYPPSLSLTTRTGAAVYMYVQMASFVGPKTVVVNGVEYTADHINIAVGGRPVMPDVPGVEFCIDRQGRRFFCFSRFLLLSSFVFLSFVLRVRDRFFCSWCFVLGVLF